MVRFDVTLQNGLMSVCISFLRCDVTHNAIVARKSPTNSLCRDGFFHCAPSLAVGFSRRSVDSVIYTYKFQ